MVERKKPGRRKARRKFQFSSVNRRIMAEQLTIQNLMDAGVHFGHLTRKVTRRWQSTSTWKTTESTWSIWTNGKMPWWAIFSIKNIVRVWSQNHVRSNEEAGQRIVFLKLPVWNMPYVRSVVGRGMLTNLLPSAVVEKTFPNRQDCMKDESL